MILKNKKFVANVLLLIILASCSSTSKDLQNSFIQHQDSSESRSIQEIANYQSFLIQDLYKIEEILENQELNQTDLSSMRLLKANYKKILSKKKFILKINPNEKYSRKIIKLVYEINLPIKILWEENQKNSLPSNLLSNKINGFCNSIYDDALTSINKNLNQEPDSKLVIFSQKYLSFLEKLRSESYSLAAIKYEESNFQDFAAETLGVNSSERRFKKISSLNPNQNLKFRPRPRSDFEEIILLINPEDFKSMIPALRYHGGTNYKYFNFISVLEEINNPLQFFDFEDSYLGLSQFMVQKIKANDLVSLENFLQEGILKDWLLVNILKQSGAQSTEISGVTGTIFYQSNSCAKREIPLQKISPELFSS